MPFGRPRRMARWKAKLSNQFPTWFELYHPSYGTYWLPDGDPHKALTGARKKPASDAIRNKFAGYWREAVNIARNAP